MGEPVRLQKILAAAGLGSRRGCEAFITEGRVSVDGAVVSELGAKADVESQSVEFDGRKVAGPGKVSKSFRDAEDRVYYALNKPKGALCTNEDPSGRPVAVRMIPEKRRIFCVGRLDLDTEGLIILTNDGDLTNRLTHPRYGVPKTYLARVEGELGPTQMRKLQSGVHLAEGRTQGAKVRIRRKEGRHATLEITIAEGMNRQVRRMLARVELKCRNLKRIAIGPLKLNEMQPGEFRRITADELERLNRAIVDAEAAANAPREERPAREEREERPSRDERPQRTRDRADRNKFKREEFEHADSALENAEEFEDEDEHALDAVREVAAKSTSGAPSRRRVIDSDDEELEDADAKAEKLASDGADEGMEETADKRTSGTAHKELSEAEDESADVEGDEDAETTVKSADGEVSDEETEEDEAAEALLDEQSTERAVEAMDETRPWEKAGAKSGKMWADRGNTKNDSEITAAAAEFEREKVRADKEKYAAAAGGERRDPREVHSA